MIIPNSSLSLTIATYGASESTLLSIAVPKYSFPALVDSACKPGVCVGGFGSDVVVPGHTVVVVTGWLYVGQGGWIVRVLVAVNVEVMTLPGTVMVTVLVGVIG